RLSRQAVAIETGPPHRRRVSRRSGRNAEGLNPPRRPSRSISTSPMDPSVKTSALLPVVAGGDIAAFEELYDRYSSTLYALLIRILGNTEDAQEVLQEAFVKAWTSAKMFDALRGSEIAWLISVARSRGIDRLRA